MSKLEKFKWYIIGYILYVTVVLYLAKEEYQWGRNEFWLLCLVWCVAIPLVGYTVVHFFKKFLFTKEQPKEDELIVKAELEMSVPLVDFARIHGAMKINSHIDDLTGKTKTTECLFTTVDGTKTHVWVANNIKDYSAEDISKNKDNLYVMMMPSGEYCLCIPWEDVEL